MVGERLLILLFFILMSSVVYGVECASDCSGGTCICLPGSGCEDTISFSWDANSGSGSATLYDGDCMDYNYVSSHYVSDCGECDMEGCSCSCSTGSHTGAQCTCECDDIDGPSDCHYDCAPYAYGTAMCGAGYFWSSSGEIVPEFFTYCDGISKPRFVKLGVAPIHIYLDESMDFETYLVDSGDWEMTYDFGGDGAAIISISDPTQKYVFVAFYTDDDTWSKGTLYIIGFNCCDPTIRSTFSSWCSSVSCCEPSETSCTDGEDNDCDGYTDCADIDCCYSCVGREIPPEDQKDGSGDTYVRCTSDFDCSSACLSGSTCACVYADSLSPKTWLYSSVYDYEGVQVSSSCGICLSQTCLQCGSYSVCDCDELYLKCGVKSTGFSCFYTYKDSCGKQVKCRLIQLSEGDCKNGKYDEEIDLRDYIDFNSCAVYSCEYDTQCSVGDFLKDVTWEIDDGEKQGSGYVIPSGTIDCLGDNKITVHVGVQDILSGYCGGTKINCGECCDGREKCYTAVLEIYWRQDGDGDGGSSCSVDCSSAQTSSSEYDISGLYTAYNCGSVSCTLESQPGSGAYLDDCDRIYNMTDTGLYGIKVTGDSVDSCTIWIEKTSGTSCSATGSISCPSQSGNTLEPYADIYITDGTIYSGTCSATDGVSTYSGTFVKDSETKGHCEFTSLPNVSGSLSLTINADVDIHDIACDQDRTLSLSETCDYTQQVGHLDIEYDYPAGECGEEITVTLRCVDADTGSIVDNVRWTITDVSGVVVSSTCDSGDNPCTVTVITNKYAPSVSFKARCEVT